MAQAHEIDAALAALAVVYPHHFKQYGRDAVGMARKLYHTVLADIDSRLLDAAVLQWLSTDHAFHPSPGQLRDLALALVTSDEPNAEDAWAEVRAAMRNVGYYRVPAWSNARIARVMASFDWRDLCLTDMDKLSYVRDQFIKTYNAYLQRERADDLMLAQVREAVDELKVERAKAMIGQVAKRLSISDVTNDKSSTK